MIGHYCLKPNSGAVIDATVSGRDDRLSQE